MDSSGVGWLVLLLLHLFVGNLLVFLSFSYHVLVAHLGTLLLLCFFLASMLTLCLSFSSLWVASLAISTFSVAEVLAFFGPLLGICSFSAAGFLTFASSIVKFFSVFCVPWLIYLNIFWNKRLDDKLFSFQHDLIHS